MESCSSPKFEFGGAGGVRGQADGAMGIKHLDGAGDDSAKLR